MNDIQSQEFPLATLVPSEEEKRWAAGTHIGVMLLALLTTWIAGLAGVAGAAGVLMLNPLDSAFVRRHAKEAFNFNFSIFLYAVIGLAFAVVFAVLTLGIGLLLVIPLAFIVGLGMAIAWLVCSINAAQHALEGRDYRYPFSLRLWK
jgi:uncharacterized Tic20 family protein